MQSEKILSNSKESESSMLAPATGSSKINVGTEERIVSALVGGVLTSYGLRHITSLGGLLLTTAGGLLLSRGFTGYCMVNNAIGRNSVNRRTSAMEAKASFIINKPRYEVYAFWRQLANLPLFMKHLESVKVEDSFRSVWTAKVPGNLGTVSWEAAITEDREGEYLSWSSLPGSTIDNAGFIEFKDTASIGETEINIQMTYRLPGGDLGTLAGKLFNPIFEGVIKEDIKRFKSIMETGESPASEVSELSKLEVKQKKARQSRKKASSIGSDSDTDALPYNGSEAMDGL
jgi:uncharacterized membrane protein